MRKIYIVTLTDIEIALLEDMLNKGKYAAQKRKRAFALLHVHKGWTDRQISDASGMTVNAIQLLRQRFVEHGFEATLAGLPKQARPRIIDGNAEAHLVALACSEKPAGHKRWTLRILAEKLVALGCVEEVSHETIRQVLKKRNQTLAAAGVVHSAKAGRRIRGAHGGRA